MQTSVTIVVSNIYRFPHRNHDGWFNVVMTASVRVQTF